MSYAKGSVAQASDYNALAGITASAAANSAAAQKVAGYLWGVGYGDRGYGQTSPALANVSVGAVDQNWANLQTILNNMATWQNTATTGMPTAANLAAGAVTAAYPTGNSPSLVDFLSTLDTNRLNYITGNMTLTSSVATNTRATTWGLSGGSITGTFTVTFASADAARYFFNTGGEIRIALAHPNTSTTRDADWNTVLSGLVVAVRANASARLTGSYGTAQAVGYYQLTGSNQAILSDTVFPSPYTTNSFYVYASVSGAASNGGPGNVITFTITLNDTYYTAQDTTGVHAGTNAVLSHLRAGSVLSVLPAAPTCAVGTNF